MLPKKLFSLQNNSLISKWSQIDSLIEEVNSYEFTNQDLLQQSLDLLYKMVDAHDLPHFSFLLAQLKLLFKPPEGRRYDTNTMMFAMQLHNISPSAYRMIRRSGCVVLPSSEKITQLLSGSLQDINLKHLFDQLKSQQKLVNIMFDEVKLLETLRFTGGHVKGYAENVEHQQEVLASHAMVVEVACHYGGPKYILRVVPCKKLKTDQLKEILLKASSAVVTAGGSVICLICDNCNTNRSVFSKLGGPGMSYIPSIQEQPMFLVYDFVP